MYSRFEHSIERLPRWLFTIICFCLIIWLTLLPKPLGDTHIELFKGADKVVHAIMFGGLSLCICFDWWRTHAFSAIPSVVICISVVFSSLWGGIIEILQDNMGLGRSLDVYDFIADSVGAVLFATGWQCFCRYYGKQDKRG